MIGIYKRVFIRIRVYLAINSSVLKSLKKLVLVCIAFANFAVTEVNITQGTMSPIVLAVPMFHDESGSYNSGSLGDQIRSIIINDLLKSGMFKLTQYNLISSKDGLDHPVQIEKLRNSNIRIFVACSIRESMGGYIVQVKIVHDTGANPEIQKLTFKLTGDNFRLLAHQIANAVYQIAWSIPGDFDSQIVTILKHKNNCSLAVMDRDGYNAEVILMDRIILTPTATRDGQFIAYAKYVGNYPVICLYNRKTKKHTQITQNGKTCCAPMFTNDGSQLLFSKSEGPRTVICAVDPRNPSKVIQLTNNKASIDTTPTYTASSDHIIIISDREKKPKPYVLSLSSGSVQKIRTGVGSYYEPSCCINPFNPALTQLCYSQRRAGKAYIGMLLLDRNFDVVQERILWQGFMLQGPSWSLNGSTIFFSRQGINMLNIFTGATSKIQVQGEYKNVPCESPVVVVRPKFMQTVSVYA